jgi:hypothetical protein
MKSVQPVEGTTGSFTDHTRLLFNDIKYGNMTGEPTKRTCGSNQSNVPFRPPNNPVQQTTKNLSAPFILISEIRYSGRKRGCDTQ